MKVIDHLKLKKLLQYKPTLNDCAGFFDCSEDTITRHIQKIEKMSFYDFRQQCMSSTRLRLMQKTINLALKGDATMLKFAMKNLNGWKENPENVHLEQVDCELEFIHD